ncbi:hypothetical protein HK096_000528 [Nowakowskiella sp. JEL0078]|nr:hypothetical protein HK096_000528 [Nowakowskiella sp. JEL0078]
MQKLNLAYTTLEKYGFNPWDIEASMETTCAQSVASNLDWLVLNVPVERLPSGYADAILQLDYPEGPPKLDPEPTISKIPDIPLPITPISIADDSSSLTIDSEIQDDKITPSDDVSDTDSDPGLMSMFDNPLPIETSTLAPTTTPTTATTTTTYIDLSIPKSWTGATPRRLLETHAPKTRLVFSPLYESVAGCGSMLQIHGHVGTVRECRAGERLWWVDKGVLFVVMAREERTRLQKDANEFVSV